MEWIQVFTIIASTLGGIYVFYQITNKEIAVMRQDSTIRDAQHREDMNRMESKWERLFERLLLQDKKVNKGK
jgi:hypothetical protein